MRSNSYTVFGKPQAQKRPRMSIQKRGAKVFPHVYDSQKEERSEMRKHIMQQMRDKRILRHLEGCLSVNMIFHMPTPKNKLKTHLNKPHDTKPDIDNLAKFALDTLNGLVFEDDKSISELLCKKIYSDTPRTEITICEIGDG